MANPKLVESGLHNTSFATGIRDCMSIISSNAWTPLNGCLPLARRFSIRLYSVTEGKISPGQPSRAQSSSCSCKSCTSLSVGVHLARCTPGRPLCVLLSSPSHVTILKSLDLPFTYRRRPYAPATSPNVRRSGHTVLPSLRCRFCNIRLSMRSAV